MEPENENEWYLLRQIPQNQGGNEKEKGEGDKPKPLPARKAIVMAQRAIENYGGESAAKKLTMKPIGLTVAIVSPPTEEQVLALKLVGLGVIPANKVDWSQLDPATVALFNDFFARAAKK